MNSILETIPEYDVVVLGAGIAGLSTSVAAAQAGLRVALLEKTVNIGGSSAMSGGFFAFSGTDEQTAAGVEDSEELFLHDLLEVGSHANDPKLLKAYLNNQQATYQWLKDLGITFSTLELSSGQSTARSHLSPIKDLLAKLQASLAEQGGALFTEHAATALTRGRSGRVNGVTALGPDGATSFRTRGGVVIASGGFSRGTDLLRTFAPEQLAALPYGGIGNTGDGLKMAWKLGAGLADMAYISGTYGSHPATGMDFHELLTAYYMGAIIVNKHGRRFTDESQSYKTLGAATLTQPEGLGFEIFDSVVRARSHPGVPLNDVGFLEDIGHVIKADSLEELAAEAGIDVPGLLATVETYNNAVGGKIEDEFARTALCNGVGELVPISKAPFYAYPAKTLMTSTYCGITITPEARVTAVDGEVIPGLYAVGEVTGGFHGAAYMTGTSLGKGAVFGRIAAATIAQELATVPRN
ncbi:FAD-dependent oxidoreductase [Arthrobacter sp. AK01]|uniref:FAD-dependent oxidoreductase n=1 Tax=Arthrobacter sp. AK01 TaxID=2894084 RepID=UPI001E34A144|nr:FAD-dependent oxidoreductase [Arthrobacter sp. AK01]MCD4852638.1 FAD-dependent oxidoreductase [Arthrobacter sp. AK01]